MKNKKRILICLSLLLFSTLLVSAVWFMSLKTTGNYLITSTEPELGFTIFFTGANISTIDSAQTFTDRAVISNPGEDTWVNATIEIIKTDELNDTCADYENDCTANFTIAKIDGAGILDFVDGEDYKLIGGAGPVQTEIKSYITCKRYSCPQDISVKIELTPDFDRA